jgi:hypothetical protein
MKLAGNRPITNDNEASRNNERKAKSVGVVLYTIHHTKKKSLSILQFLN